MHVACKNLTQWSLCLHVMLISCARDNGVSPKLAWRVHTLCWSSWWQMLIGSVCLLDWCYAPQLSGQSKQWAYACNNHGCQSNKLMCCSLRLFKDKSGSSRMWLSIVWYNSDCSNVLWEAVAEACQLFSNAMQPEIIKLGGNASRPFHLLHCIRSIITDGCLPDLIHVSWGYHCRSDPVQVQSCRLHVSTWDNEVYACMICSLAVPGTRVCPPS